MSIRKCGPAMGAALLTVMALENPCEAQSPPSEPKPAVLVASGVTTIKVPANKDVAIKVMLPPHTHKVGMKTGAAPFTCKDLQLVTEKARNATDEYFSPVDPISLPAHMDSTQAQNPPGSPYVLVLVRCRGGAADSQLVITPSP